MKDNLAILPPKESSLTNRLPAIRVVPQDTNNMYDPRDMERVLKASLSEGAIDGKR